MMFTWLIVSFANAIVLKDFLIETAGFYKAFAFSAFGVICGMLIMFAASVLNLRKLAPGFKRLAEGEENPEIPPVWCPVLTAATNAALRLSEKIRAGGK